MSGFFNAQDRATFPSNSCRPLPGSQAKDNNTLILRLMGDGHKRIALQPGRIVLAPTTTFAKISAGLKSPCQDRAYETLKQSVWHNRLRTDGPSAT